MKRVWLDTDPAIGIKYRDVDDALALLFLLASPEVELDGISVTFGNTNVHNGYGVAGEVLDVARSDVPFYKGAASSKDFGKPTSASEALVKHVAENPGEISLVAVGPLTNVATAMTLDKNFVGNLRELIVMGGSLKFWPFSYSWEFNFYMDGRASSMVMAAPIHKTLLTMDVCSQAIFKREHLEEINRHDSDVARYLAEHIPSWLNLNRVIFRKGGFYPWDPVAVGYLLDESMFDKNPVTFSLIEEGMRRSKILNLKEHDSFDEVDGRIPVNMPRKMEADRFMKLFIDRLLSL